MTVYVLPNNKSPDAIEVAHKVCDILHSTDISIVTDHNARDIGLSHGAVAKLSAEDAAGVCDVLLCIGGDGTMLHAARHIMHTSKLLLGVNTGRLGFLTALEADELDKLRLLSTGDYFVEERMTIEASYAGSSRKCVAMNDIVLFKNAPERTISLNIHCDGIEVSRFRGDGVIFATPTGSSAYSMSAGGPIVDARLGGIVITQICAHIVQTPPLVFAADRVLQVTVCGHDEETVCIVCDGRTEDTLRPAVPLRLTRSQTTVKLVQFKKAQQLQSIDKKLKGW